MMDQGHEEINLIKKRDATIVHYVARVKVTSRDLTISVKTSGVTEGVYCCGAVKFYLSKS